MKFIYYICHLMFLASILVALMIICFNLKEVNQKFEQPRQVHWLLPQHGDCAVKEMFFQIATKDGKTKLKKQDRMVCHWSLK